MDSDRAQRQPESCRFNKESGTSQCFKAYRGLVPLHSGLQTKEIVSLEKVSTIDNVADAMTKSLSTDRFQSLRDWMGVELIPDELQKKSHFYDRTLQSYYFVRTLV
jgi:hypothetical protein